MAAAKLNKEQAEVPGIATGARDCGFARKVVDCPGMVLFHAVAAIRLVRQQYDGPPS